MCCLCSVIRILPTEHVLDDGKTYANNTQIGSSPSDVFHCVGLLMLECSLEGIVCRVGVFLQCVMTHTWEFASVIAACPGVVSICLCDMSVFIFFEKKGSHRV